MVITNNVGYLDILEEYRKSESLGSSFKWKKIRREWYCKEKGRLEDVTAVKSEWKRGRTADAGITVPGAWQCMVSVL